MNDVYYVRVDDVITFPVHDGCALHNLNNDVYYNLQEGVATFIWNILNGDKRVSEIIETVSKECCISSAGIKEDIEEFMEDLLSNELIEEVFNK